MRRFLRFALGFLAAAAWFSLLISWTGFTDPDVFYHAKMGLLIWQHGPVMAFPQLDLTYLGMHFADLHFLFHVLLAPFVAMFGLFNGARIVAVLLCAIFLLVFYACLRWLKIPYAFWWAVLLAFTQPFLVRMLLGKATPLAVLLFILGLTALWKRRPWLVALVTMAYALSHGGWTYLAGSCVLLTCGEIVYRHVVLDFSWRAALERSPWRETVASFAGAFVGLLVHPNFPNVFLLSWVENVVIGLGTPFQHVVLGNEWLPTDPGALISSFAAWAVFIIVGLGGLLLAPRKPLDHGRARFLTSISLILAVLMALTLKSRRNVEYLAPVVAVWCAALWSLIDLSAFWHEVKENTRGIPQGIRRFLLVTCALLVCFLVVRGPWEAYSALHPSTLPDNSYQAAMHPISVLASPGDRVFHSSWDEFPVLFAIDDRLRYISGYDPTMLYIASSTLSDQVRDVTSGATTTTQAAAWSLIHDELHSRFVFITKPSHLMFYNLVDSDDRYHVLYDSSDTASFEIMDP
ncbi:MAG: hypothetical protein WA001_05685 [Patescibacteria group bacterium]